MSSNHYDVIIIGSGAGGGTLAYKLAPSGKRILLLERGNYVRREKENWSSKAVNIEGRYQTQEHWRDKDGKDLHPHTNYYVGGNTKFYGAALFRLRKEDFGEIKHYSGTSPAWPITYEELEPYYATAEKLYHVHGAQGEDPTEPVRSGEFPYPAVSHEPRLQRLSDDFAAAGVRPFHTPLGVQLDEKNSNESRCIRCGTCDGFPCLVHAKSDAEVVAVRPALRYPNVTLLTDTKVDRLTTSSSGREVTGVEVTRNGEHETYSADIVVVSAGAINSAALLLRSANDMHPNGLANGSDVVGRHYMGHINSVVMAISRCPNPTVFQKTLSVNDYYLGASDFPYPMGHISFVGKLDLDALRAGAPPFAPGFTLEMMASHSLDFWLTSEDLPDPNNRVTLDRDGNIVLNYTINNDEGHKRLKAKLQGLMKHISCPIHGKDCHQGIFDRSLYVGQRIPLAGVAHQNGTIRFGHDPTTSALDVNCKAHELDNLYVVDGSFFPSSGAVNPALTIIANSLRVGDHLLERLGSKAVKFPETAELEVAVHAAEIKSGVRA